ncbi:MAG: DUF937 domain-containing protein [Gammaproteobacteria bacterium]|jgi:uncharacterized protein YidB (DUF937 family)|nr:DUF937 domain-containing protein [Gammaproteobacteria bacterium]
MDIQQLLRLGAQAFQSQLGAQLADSISLEGIMGGLAELLPGDGDNVDLGKLVGRMQGGGLSALAESWLGDGGNEGLGADQVRELLGPDAIERFAGKLDLDEGQAVEGLKGALPEMIDKASSGGSLDILGGASGLLGAASGLFGR